MDLLIDTHILIWDVQGNKSLKPENRKLIDDAENQVFVSIVALWEIVIKSSLGKLNFTSSPKEVQDFLIEKNIHLLDIQIRDLEKLRSLPHLHRDPFDRLMVAQAKANDFRFISQDPKVEEYFKNS